MTTQDISLLGFALLGLLHQKPASGYDLRKIFAATAMASFSDSPGAIYPALRRLESAGLIRSAVEDGPGLRRRRVFSPAPPGTTQLKRWLQQPVTRDDVARRSHQTLLRFAFTDRVLGSSAAVALLEELQNQLALYIPTLKRDLRRQADVIPLAGMLALVSGIKQYESLLSWTKLAIATYEKRRKRKHGKKERTRE